MNLRTFLLQLNFTRLLLLYITPTLQKAIDNQILPYMTTAFELFINVYQQVTLVYGLA